MRKIPLFLLCMVVSVFTFFGCEGFFSDGVIEEEVKNVTISSLSLSKNTLSLKAGEIDYLSTSTTPISAKAEITINWTYDESIISVSTTGNNAVITGLKEGQTSLIAEYGGYSAICIITVAGQTEEYLENNQYIYSNTTTLQLKPDTRQRFYVSLSGGNASDVNGFQWTIDNPSIASINTTGQYCDVTGLKEGYARITVTHNKAPEFPYNVGIYVFEDNTDATYITSENNVVTLYKAQGQKEIEVDLVNPLSENYNSNFTFQILDNSNIISLSSNAEKAILEPLQQGTCTVRVNHPDATGNFPLDIMVRVIEIVENVFIKTADSVVKLYADEEKTISVSLDGLEIDEYDNADFEFSVENEDVISTFSNGNQIILRGVKNGSTKILISHPKSAKMREILVISEGQAVDAIDTSHYITTSQNYIKTKVGASETELSMLLKGSTTDSANDFTWTVTQNPDDGSSDVIRVTSTNGNIVSNILLSTVGNSGYTQGKAYIEPLHPGTATIIVSHTEAHYDTEVLVKVLPETAILEEPFWFSGGSSIVKFLNSEQYDYSISLNGSTETTVNDIVWQMDNDNLKIQDSGSDAILSSTGTGNCVGTMTITHPRVLNPKKVLVLTADTEEELESLKAFYTDKSYYSLNKGETTSVYVNQVGFGSTDPETSEYTPEDFSTIQWTSNNISVATVEKNVVNPLMANITAKGVGSAEITANYNNITAKFYITVYPEDVNIGKVDKTVYLTTVNNVVYLDKNETSTVRVSAIGLPTSEYSKTEWISSDETIATVVGNGTSATIEAITEDEAEIKVSHPQSENELSIYVRIGNRFIDKTPPVSYISSNLDVVEIVKNSQAVKITNIIVNPLEGSKTNDFTYTIDDESIATITGSFATGSCFIKPEMAGMTELTVSHDGVMNKKILIVVANTQDELNELKYLSTNQNTIIVPQGNTKNVTVHVKNTNDVILDGFTWESLDNSIVSITESSAATAVITGNEIGITKLKVSQEDCNYPLEIIVQCVDPQDIFQNPYVQTSASVLNLPVSTTWTTVKAELIGGEDNDDSNIQWTSSNSTVLQVLGEGDTAKIRAIGEGTAYVSASHTKAPYNQQILVICEKAEEKPCTISVSENIINLKPGSSVKNISASLLNGTTEDKVNFRWSVDVYDVIDMTWNANTAQITPLKEGQATITISHPKSAYDQQIIVKVSEHTDFAFSTNTKTLQEGKVSFVSMQIPASSVDTHVVYSSDSPLVAVAQGTKAVCQITGLDIGTTVIRAKLIATNTNAILAEAEMLLNVEEGTSNLVYITSSSTIFTMEKGTNKTFSATLTGNGVIPTDQHNLQWKSNDPTIAKIKATSDTGVATGQSVYVEALKAGETTITVSHPKSNTSLVLYIIVPGSAEKTISLSKGYATIEKGRSTEIKAKITDGTNEDYNNITWTAGKVNNNDIVRIMGKGNTISVYGLTPGTTTIRAELSKDIYAECEVKVESPKSFAFDNQTTRILPNAEKTIGYTISPVDASISFVANTDEYISFTDNGNNNGDGSVTIEGIKPGTTTLTGVSNYGSRASISITCAWDYSFYVETTYIQGTPDKEYSIPFTVSPKDANITFDPVNCADINILRKPDGTGEIKISPKGEGKNVEFQVKAVNPNDNNHVIDTKTVKLNLAYSNFTIIPKLTRIDGKYSTYDSVNNIIELGDGEKIKMDFSVAEKYADCKITYTLNHHNEKDKSIVTMLTDAQASEDNRIISHNVPYEESDYVIKKGYHPYYLSSYDYNEAGERINEVWTAADIDNFSWKMDEHTWKSWRNSYLREYWILGYNGYTNFDIDHDADVLPTYQYRDSNGNLLCNYDERYKVVWAIRGSEGSSSTGTFFKKERDASLDNKRLSQSEFEQTAWYYNPGYKNLGPNGLNVSAGVINIDAEKVPVISDAEVSNIHVATLSVTIESNVTGKTTTETIPIHEVKRACAHN